MADTIPADNHVIGDSGHVTDHNNMADMLGLLTQALAQMTGTVSAINSTNVTAVSNAVTNSQYGYPALASQISNTVTGTSLATLASGTYNSGAATGVGWFAEIEAWGSGTSAATSGTTLEFAIVFGGVTMSNVTLGANFMAVNTSFRWWTRSRVMCITTGSSATWQSQLIGFVSVNGTTLLTSGASSANATNGFTSSEITSTSTVASNSNQTLALQAAWGSSVNSPTLTGRWIIKRNVT